MGSREFVPLANESWASLIRLRALVPAILAVASRAMARVGAGSGRAGCATPPAGAALGRSGVTRQADGRAIDQPISTLGHHLLALGEARGNGDLVVRGRAD